MDGSIRLKSSTVIVYLETTVHGSIKTQLQRDPYTWSCSVLPNTQSFHSYSCRLYSIEKEECRKYEIARSRHGLTSVIKLCDPKQNRTCICLNVCARDVECAAKQITVCYCSVALSLSTLV